MFMVLSGCRMADEQLIEEDLERSTRGLVEALPRYLPGRTEENYGKPHPE
jgi:hypothetical protein